MARVAVMIMLTPCDPVSMVGFSDTLSWVKGHKTMNYAHNITFLDKNHVGKRNCSTKNEYYSIQKNSKIPLLMK